MAHIGLGWFRYEDLRLGVSGVGCLGKFSGGVGVWV